MPRVDRDVSDKGSPESDQEYSSSGESDEHKPLVPNNELRNRLGKGRQPSKERPVSTGTRSSHDYAFHRTVMFVLDVLLFLMHVTLFTLVIIEETNVPRPSYSSPMFWFGFYISLTIFTFGVSLYDIWLARQFIKRRDISHGDTLSVTRRFKMSASIYYHVLAFIHSMAVCVTCLHYHAMWGSTLPHENMDNPYERVSMESAYSSIHVTSKGTLIFLIPMFIADKATWFRLVEK